MIYVADILNRDLFDDFHEKYKITSFECNNGIISFRSNWRFDWQLYFKTELDNIDLTQQSVIKHHEYSQQK